MPPSPLSPISEPSLNFTLEPGNSEKTAPPHLVKDTSPPGILGYLPTSIFWCLRIVLFWEAGGLDFTLGKSLPLWKVPARQRRNPKFPLKLTSAPEATSPGGRGGDKEPHHLYFPTWPLPSRTCCWMWIWAKRCRRAACSGTAVKHNARCPMMLLPSPGTAQ